MLLFEFFPAFLAIVALIVGLVLYAGNRRARHENETPRAPSQPPVSPEEAAAESPASVRRPSMRA